MVRHLAAVSDVREVGSDQYVHSKYSRGLASNPLVDAFKYMYVHATSGVALFHDLGADTSQLRRLLQGMGRYSQMACGERVATCE